MLGDVIQVYQAALSHRLTGFVILVGLGAPVMVWGAWMALTRDASITGALLVTGVGLASAGGILTAAAWHAGERPRLSCVDAASPARWQASAGPWLVISGIVLAGGSALNAGLVVAALGLFLATLPIAWAVRDARSRGRTGYLLAEGFCYVDPRGNAVSVRWDEIDQLWVSPSGHNILVTVQKLDGQQITFGDPWLRDYQGFVRAIEEKTAVTKLPDIRRDLDKGAQVSFGPITLTRTGLIKESYIFPIAELDEVGVEARRDGADGGLSTSPDRKQVRIVHKGKSYTWPDLTVADIANFHAMMRVLEEHGKARQPYY